MSEPSIPSVTPGERTFSEFRQITVHKDDEVAGVNELVKNGWRLVSVGQQAAATVYVLGRFEERPRHRAGFMASEKE
jgi:hypothetical protein